MAALKAKLTQLIQEDDGVLVHSSSVSDEKKTVPLTPYIPDGVETVVSNPRPTSLLIQTSPLLAGGILGNVNRTFRMRMTRAATLTTGGGGTMNLATFVSPTQMDQYSQVGSLFQWARLKRLRIEYTGAIPAGSTAIPAWMAIGYTFTNTGLTPSFSQTIRLPNSKTISSVNVNWPIVLDAKLPKDIPWTQISLGTGSDPISGAPGQFYHCINGAVSGSTNYFNYFIVADYEFKMQQ